MSGNALRRVPRDDEMLFVALGGLGEIGMNFYMYGHAGRWLVVDCGVTFADEDTPGVDVIVPDISFAVANADLIDGIVLTHGHEDHLGAIEYLWDRIGAPVYATPFTASFLKRKLAESDQIGEVPIRRVEVDGRIDVGPFDIEFVNMTHSIPEPSLLVIHTPLGQLVHTGDWKLDPDPLVAKPVDEQRIRDIGDAGVYALICDSTNAMVEGTTRSEGALLPTLTEIVQSRKGRVAFACFASNVARLRSIATAAAAAGRNCGLVGRSLRRMSDVAKETGYLEGLAPFVSEEHIGYLPRRDAVMICTGSQGEPRAALARIASGSHPHVTLEAGDTVVFSSRDIPGNEKAIGRLQNQLVSNDIEIVTSEDAFVHVSGHPARDEMRRLFEWINPAVLVPMHGEMQHLRANAALARECDVPKTALVLNGQMLRFDGNGGVHGDEEVPVGRMALDGRRLVPTDGEVIRSRKRLLHQGIAMATIVLDRNNEICADPAVTLQGLPGADESDEDPFGLLDLIEDAIEGMARKSRNDEAVEKVVRSVIRRCLRAETGKRPQTTVHVVRLD